MRRLNNNIQRLLEQQMWQLVFLHISLYQADAENLRFVLLCRKQVIC